MELGVQEVRRTSTSQAYETGSPAQFAGTHHDSGLHSEDLQSYGGGIWARDGHCYRAKEGIPSPKLVPRSILSDVCSPKAGNYTNPCQNRPIPKLKVLREENVEGEQIMNSNTSQTKLCGKNASYAGMKAGNKEWCNKSGVTASETKKCRPITLAERLMRPEESQVSNRKFHTSVFNYKKTSDGEGTDIGKVKQIQITMTLDEHPSKELKHKDKISWFSNYRKDDQHGSSGQKGCPHEAKKKSSAAKKYKPPIRPAKSSPTIPTNASRNNIPRDKTHQSSTKVHQVAEEKAQCPQNLIHNVSQKASETKLKTTKRFCTIRSKASREKKLKQMELKEAQKKLKQATEKSKQNVEKGKQKMKEGEKEAKGFLSKVLPKSKDNFSSLTDDNFHNDLASLTYKEREIFINNFFDVFNQNSNFTSYFNKPKASTFLQLPGIVLVNL